MEFSISYRGAPVGTGSIAPERGGVRVTARCRVRTNAVLRLYGVGPDARTIRIGVLEPDADGLSLTRLLTAETLRTAGYALDTLPETYELSDGMAAVRPAALPEPAYTVSESGPVEPASAGETPIVTPAVPDPLAPVSSLVPASAPVPAALPPRTGDALVDAGIADGVLTSARTADGICVSCPFTPGAACPLAFALTACTVSDGCAVLHLPAASL